MTTQVVTGERIRGFAGAWYRHDTVFVNGAALSGCIQVRRRFLGKRFGHRIETITVFGASCVMGSNVAWLARMNEVTL